MSSSWNFSISEFFTTWKVFLKLNTTIQIHNLIIFKDKKIDFHKKSKFQFSSQFCFLSWKEKITSRAENFSDQAKYGLSQLGLDTSLVISTYIFLGNVSIRPSLHSSIIGLHVVDGRFSQSAYKKVLHVQWAIFWIRIWDLGWFQGLGQLSMNIL